MAMQARDHRIALPAAAALTRRYREGIGKGEVKASAFHADQVRGLLAQPGCVALRIYYATDADGHATLVLVGVGADDKDLSSGVLLEFGIPCPPFCDDGSLLSS
jgi:hypothetical protein